MSKVLSGYALDGFKRWQVPDVSAGNVSDIPAGRNKYLTAVQMERIQKQAYDEAYIRGLQEGMEAGQSQMRENAQLFIGLANALQDPVREMDQKVVKMSGQKVLPLGAGLLQRT